jgi:hypothetical protein
MIRDDPFIRRPGAVATAVGPPIDVPAAVVESLPEAVARENLVVPLRLDGETLFVAAANAADVMLRDKLSFILNKKVVLVPTPRPTILDAINRLYGQTETESVDSMLVEFTDTAVDLDDAEVRAFAGTGPARAAGAVKFEKRGWGRGQRADDSVAAIVRDLARGGRPGLDRTHPTAEGGMFFYVVPDGQRVLRTRPDGRMDVIVGPARGWRGRSRFQRMDHYVAHPGDYLVVRYRDGRQDHLPGPAEVWLDPRVHLDVRREEALQVAAKEAVVVYSRADAGVSRRVVVGPTLFVPAPGEWLHTFTWHGSDGGSTGTAKVAKGLVFQKLWLMPDQMYHDVPDVRTADDAVLTVKLMIFFELLDIGRMLDTTHDPIGDFVNAATSDVVDFTGRRTFEQFKTETGRLNELESYPQLAARAAQTGYRINKVVYRGYGAPARLQAMHDQAIEARTKLELDRATEEQAQELEDFRLAAQVQRAARRRAEQATEADAEIELGRRRQEAEREHARRTAEVRQELRRQADDRQREHARRTAEVRQELRRQADDRQREHLAALKAMGVDLTAYLTQGRADRVIELRGANGTHVHLDRADGA